MTFPFSDSFLCFKENRMGKCDYCTKIKDELKKTRETRAREQILQKRKEHKELIR